MPETILPGTYITVRDEGLITAGQVATGNIGIVGTASKGPINEVQILGSFTEAKAIFGDKGTWNNNATDNLTLIRSLEYIFNNGGSKVYAVRTAASTAKVATYQLQYTGMGANIIKLVAQSPGTWGNQISVSIGGSTSNAVLHEKILVTTTNVGALTLNRGNVDASQSISIKLRQNATGNTLSFEVFDLNSSDFNNTMQHVRLDDVTGALTFATDFTPVEDDQIMAVYEVKFTNSKKVQLKYNGGAEVYIIADILHFQEQIIQLSSLITTNIVGTAPDYGVLPDNSNGEELFGTGQVSATVLHGPGNNGADTDPDDYKDSLEKLENEIVNIVLLAGQDAADSRIRAALEGHINTTESIQRERIGLIGCSKGNLNTTVATIGTEAGFISSDRIVLIAPGIYVSNQEILSGGYAAAAVAGLLASVPVQTSLTNKVLTIPGLEVEFNRPQLESLVQQKVLTLEKREGYRVVKGITTDTNSAWHQITTRRIVDYAKYGVRSACNPYIGKLNNERVRGAMRATIDAFLTRMVEDEALTGYELDVTATRPQEIAGEAIVTLVLRPTFSIDFIKVTMYLG